MRFGDASPVYSNTIPKVVPNKIPKSHIHRSLSPNFNNPQKYQKQKQEQIRPKPDERVRVLRRRFGGRQGCEHKVGRGAGPRDWEAFTGKRVQNGVFGKWHLKSDVAASASSWFSDAATKTVGGTYTDSQQHVRNTGVDTAEGLYITNLDNDCDASGLCASSLGFSHNPEWVTAETNSFINATLAVNASQVRVGPLPNPTTVYCASLTV